MKYENIARLFFPAEDLKAASLIYFNCMFSKERDMFIEQQREHW